MKTIIISTILSLYALAAFSQDASESTKQDTLISYGIIHQKPFVGKDGKEISETLYYWFKTNTEDYFIKLYESEIESELLNKYIGKTVKLKYLVKYGEWDSTGNEPVPVQSRVGSYIVV